MSNPRLFEETFPVTGGSFDHAGEVASRIKQILKGMGFPGEIVRRAALVSYEAEINIVSYANSGQIRLTVIPHAILIEATDEGQGIPDITLAMQPGYSTATEKIREMGFGAGMGLCNIRSFSDDFWIDSTIGEGTQIKMAIRGDREEAGSGSNP